MTYIDDIKDNIQKVCAVRELTEKDMKYLRNKLLSGSSYDFIEKINYRAHNTDEHYMYRYITITTKTGNIYNITWNFKSDFPIYIINKVRWEGKKYLDDNFCINRKDIPEVIKELLEEFKETYLPDDKQLIK